MHTGKAHETREAPRPGVFPISTHGHPSTRLKTTSFSGPERLAGRRGQIQNIRAKTPGSNRRILNYLLRRSIVGFELNGIDLDLSDAYAGVARFIGNRPSTQRQMDRGSAWRTFTIGRYHSRQQKEPRM